MLFSKFLGGSRALDNIPAAAVGSGPAAPTSAPFQHHHHHQVFTTHSANVFDAEYEQRRRALSAQTALSLGGTPASSNNNTPSDSIWKLTEEESNKLRKSNPMIAAEIPFGTLLLSSASSAPQATTIAQTSAPAATVQAASASVGVTSPLNNARASTVRKRFLRASLDGYDSLVLQEQIANRIVKEEEERKDDGDEEEFAHRVVENALSEPNSSISDSRHKAGRVSYPSLPPSEDTTTSAGGRTALLQSSSTVTSPTQSLAGGRRRMSSSDMVAPSVTQDLRASSELDAQAAEFVPTTNLTAIPPEVEKILDQLVWREDDGSDEDFLVVANKFVKEGKLSKYLFQQWGLTKLSAFCMYHYAGKCRMKAGCRNPHNSHWHCYCGEDLRDLDVLHTRMHLAKCFRKIGTS